MEKMLFKKEEDPYEVVWEGEMSGEKVRIHKSMFEPTYWASLLSIGETPILGPFKSEEDAKVAAGKLAPFTDKKTGKTGRGWLTKIRKWFNT
jgi:hypothetical protein